MNRIKLRENIFKLLFCQEFHSPEEMHKQYEFYWDNEEIYYEEDRDYITEKVKNITDKISEIDEEIGKVAIGWSIDRMSKVDLTIMRLAYYEMKFDEDVPDKVAVDQAVELAKKYGTDQSPSFVNGILAKLF